MEGLLTMAEASRRHLPVMAGEVLSWLGSVPGSLLVDLTVGGGGHADAFLRATAPTGRVLAADRDAVALSEARTVLRPHGARVRFVHGPMTAVLGTLLTGRERADAVLMDLGVSSMQLDEPARGFSLRDDGPLDMRMDRDGGGPTAAEWLAQTPEAEIERVLRAYGDEPAAGRIARAIAARRGQRPLRSTGDLRTLVEQAVGRKGGRIHPATRAFQAIRIAVNRELDELVEALPLALRLLVPGGRLVVLAFHSGEDRIVKTAFRELAAAGHELLTPRALLPTRAESHDNPRARSARLRVLRRAGGERA